MSDEIKKDDVDEESFTVLDEVQSDEIDLTFEDDEGDDNGGTNENEISATEKSVDDSVILSVVDEEEGYLNPENGENILRELDNMLTQQNATVKEEQILEVENGDYTADDGVAENWEPVDEPQELEAIMPDKLDSVGATSALTKTDEVPSEDVSKSTETLEVAAVASNDQDEINPVPDEEEEKEGEHVTKQDTTHPYMYLIESFEFLKDQLNLTPVEEPKSLRETQFHIVTSRNPFMRMIQRLRNETEIAVDYHISRDYQGTICLMVITTKNADYIIDAIKLKHDLLLLTEIFINPKIIKILLFARRMLSCLQQRLHLYMVNVFDIEGVRAALGEEPKDCSLYHVLKRDYNIDRSQLPKPDFRLRPLPDSYKTYIRLGTHYLIHVYHVTKNKLILKDSELYKKFLENCRNLCKLMQNDPKIEKFEGIEATMKKRHTCELEVLKKLFNWRVSVAQKCNLKADLILHNGGILKLARNLSADDNDIFEVSKSPHVKKDIEKIKRYIKESKIKFNIFERQRNRKKPQKRKLNDQPETQSKQRCVENESTNVKNPVQNSEMQRRQNDYKSFNPNKNKDFSYSKKRITRQQITNFNVPSLMDKNLSSKSFFDKGSKFNNHNRNRQSFEQSEIRFSDNFNNSNANLNNANMSGSLMLNPTNIPSTFTFQTSSMNNSSSQRDDFDGLSSSSGSYIPFNNQSDRNRFEQNMQLTHGGFNQPSGSMMRQSGPNNPDSLYKTLVELKQARDNLRMQAGKYSDNLNNNRLQDLNMIDQKISLLEIKLQQMRHGNNRRDDRSNNKRRYFRN